MANMGSLRDRKRKFSLLGGRTLAVIVITVVAAVSFSLGYNVGRSGMEGQGVKDQVQVVPEGAGLVLLGGQRACEESSPGQAVPKSAEEGTSPSVAVLETMKVLSVPRPDPLKAGAGPEEPVLEPIAGQGNLPYTAKGPGDGERRVAPIGQLPAKQPEPAATFSSQEVPEGQPAIKTEAPLKKNVSEKSAVSRKTPAPENRPAIAKRPAPVKKTIASKSPAVSSDGRAYGVQIGAFSSLSDARTHRIRFTKKGYKASVYKDKGADGSDIFKVRVGIFTARSEAEKLALRLKSAEGVNGFVTAIE